MSLFTSGLPNFLLQSLKRIGIDTPTDIQGQAIPVILDGKDALITAHTGSGKTLAYLVPKIVGLANGTTKKILVLAPTRELSTQIYNVAKSIINDSQIRVANLIGGQSIVVQLKQLSRSPQIIIGTPGRVFDHLQRRSVKIDDVDCFILDEVDRMLDLGFSQQIEQIELKLPRERQNLMFSATLPFRTVKLVEKYLKDYVRITDGHMNKPAPKIDHTFEKISHHDKFQKLIDQLTAREGTVLIFVNRKIDAERVSIKLREEGLSVDSIHGDLRQGVRDRIIQKFRDQKIRIMVGTDVVARGLDVSHVRHVINYDLPICPEDYLHRIGRTGRAGETGSAFSMVSPQDSLKLRAIQRLLNPGETGSQEDSESPRSFGGRGGGSRGGGSRSFRGNGSRNGASSFSSFSSNRDRRDRDFAPRNSYSNSPERRSFSRPRSNDFSFEEKPNFSQSNSAERKSFRPFERRSDSAPRPYAGNRQDFSRSDFDRTDQGPRRRFDTFNPERQSFSGSNEKTGFNKNKFSKKPSF